MLLPIWDIQWLLQSKEVKDGRQVGDAPHAFQHRRFSAQYSRAILNCVFLKKLPRCTWIWLTGTIWGYATPRNGRGLLRQLPDMPKAFGIATADRRGLVVLVRRDDPPGSCFVGPELRTAGAKCRGQPRPTVEMGLARVISL